jgi:hypothetical protein
MGAGIWPYIPKVGILISIGLFTASIIGIVVIWKNYPFSNSNFPNEKLNKKNTHNRNKKKLNDNLILDEDFETQKNNINELLSLGLLSEKESKEKIKIINKKIELKNSERKRKEEYEKIKNKLENLLNAGLISKDEFDDKLSQFTNKKNNRKRSPKETFTFEKNMNLKVELEKLKTIISKFENRKDCIKILFDYCKSFSSESSYFYIYPSWINNESKDFIDIIIENKNLIINIINTFQENKNDRNFSKEFESYLINKLLSKKN